MGQTNAKLSKEAKAKARKRHNWCLQWCWNYEKMQAAGYAYAMVPVMKELYDTEEDQCRQLERHMNFYNTHPGGSALIMGADVALEEAYQSEMGDNLKVALMGPLAGIGDTIQGVLVEPPFSIMASSIAATAVADNSMAAGIGAILVGTLPLIAVFVLRWSLFNYGYKTGVNIISDVAGGGQLTTLQTIASILGMTVMGGFVPSMLSSLTFSVKLGSDLLNDAGEVVTAANTLQDTLDAIFPYLTPIIITGICYFMLKQRKMKPLTVLLILFAVTFVLGAVGWMSK